MDSVSVREVSTTEGHIARLEPSAESGPPQPLIRKTTMSKADGNLYRRWMKLPEGPGTADVRDTLKIPHATISSWLQNPHFKAAGVATPDLGGFYVWDTKKLLMWIVALNKIPRETRKRHGIVNQETAKKLLGLAHVESINTNPPKKLA